MTNVWDSNYYFGEYEDPFKSRRKEAETDLDITLYNLNPHYTNPRFKEAQTIWGEEERGLHYEYSDRIWQWDYNKAKEALEYANDKIENRKSPRWFQAYLSFYHDQEVELNHILSGYNLATGYPYQVFGFKFKKGDKEVDD